MTTDSEVNHRHPEELTIRSALSHYSPADNVSHEHQSMFSRAFAKIEEVLGLKGDDFMSASEMKDAHDEFYLHGGDTEAKTTVSIDRIGNFIAAAAAAEAGYAFERHASLQKFDENEKKSLDFMVGFSMAEAIKLFEQLNNRHATNEEREQIAASAGAHAKAFYSQSFAHPAQA
ncbi:hypothetical protein INT43_006699 [Umbelopsis isabellina]|uniref:Uncharacterized protein n=1 Tax=Mortierella isabellina TaxID=91625 RepID=A0A8H7Q2X6_MORIS|nr:hypothetical protein INT43_006699 [Umbelopsis isabellina]